MTDAPDKQAETGVRDPVSGRFLAGASGNPNGRPRRPDLFALASERAAASGVDLAAELWTVVQRLLAQAKAGDTQAAKLLLDRLTDPDPVKVEVAAQVQPLTDEERTQRIQELLERAAHRKAAKEQGLSLHDYFTRQARAVLASGAPGGPGRSGPALPQPEE